MREIQREYARDIVLIVTHRDVMGPLIAELHGKQPLPEIGPDDYDNVYIVTVPWFGSVKTLRLHYASAAADPRPFRRPRARAPLLRRSDGLARRNCARDIRPA